MRRFFAITLAVAALAAVPATASAYYVEYYRDNLFLGLAYHRVRSRGSRTTAWCRS